MRSVVVVLPASICAIMPIFRVLSRANSLIIFAFYRIKAQPTNSHSKPIVFHLKSQGIDAAKQSNSHLFFFIRPLQFTFLLQNLTKRSTFRYAQSVQGSIYFQGRRYASFLAAHQSAIYYPLQRTLFNMRKSAQTTYSVWYSPPF